MSGGENWLDATLAVVAAAAAVFGLVRGFVREVVGTIAVLAGFILAAHYYPNLSSLLSGAISAGPARDFISFGVIFLLFVAAGALVGRFISRHIGGMSRFVNHLLGGALGFLKGAFLCGVIVLGLAVWAKKTDVVLRSRLAAPALRVTTGLIQVAPEELKNKFRESYKRILEIKKGGRMEKKSDKTTLHQKLETVIFEMVDKELHLDDALQEFQKIFLETALKKYNGNKSRIAKALGIHRNTLHCRAKKLKIHRK